MELKVSIVLYYKSNNVKTRKFHSTLCWGLDSFFLISKK